MGFVAQVVPFAMRFGSIVAPTSGAELHIQKISEAAFRQLQELFDNNRRYMKELAQREPVFSQRCRYAFAFYPPAGTKDVAIYQIDHHLPSGERRITELLPDGETVRRIFLVNTGMSHLPQARQVTMQTGAKGSLQPELFTHEVKKVEKIIAACDAAAQAYDADPACGRVKIVRAAAL